MRAFQRAIACALALMLCFMQGQAAMASGMSVLASCPTGTSAGAPAETNAGDPVLVCNGKELQSAIDASPASGSTLAIGIDIYLSKVISVRGQQLLVIDGTDDAGAWKVDGLGRYQCFVISLDSEVTLQNLVITGGVGEQGGGFQVLDTATATLRSCVISNHTATVGGGLYVLGSASLNLFSSAIKYNQAGQGGGGLYLKDTAKAALSDCSLSHNIATSTSSYGGGAWAESQVTLKVSGCTVHANEAHYGGGFYLAGATEVSMDWTVISHSLAKGYGGGLDISGSATVTLTDCDVVDNVAVTASYGGGAIFISSNKPVSLIRCKVAGNSAGSQGGGGLFVMSSAVLQVSGSEVTDNSASGNGGGFYITSKALVTITDTAIALNKVSYGGGGIYLGEGFTGSLVLPGCAFSGNGDSKGGADVYVHPSALGTLEVLSQCLDGFFNAGTGLLACGGNTGASGCVGFSYPADLKNSACTSCDESVPYTCCGAIAATECKEEEPSRDEGTCSPAQLQVCYTPSPQPTMSFAPTSSKQPTSSPTVACQAGSLYKADENACVPCEAGKYSDVALAPWPDTCKDCGTGAISDQDGASVCILCPEGQKANTAHTECDYCKAGEYADGGQCVKCSRGKYAPTPQTNDCLLCEEGRHTDKPTGAVSCDQCHPGSVAPQAGTAVNCSLCPAGSSPSIGQVNCTLCLAGFYAPSAGSPLCLQCPAASHLESAEGSSGCGLAAEGFYLDPMSSVATAVKCPLGAVCLGGIQLPRPKKGFWVDSRDLSSCGLVSRCPRFEACIGATGELGGSNQKNPDACWTREGYSDAACGHKNGRLQCDKGSEGVLCGSCATGFTFSPVDQTCQDCDKRFLFGAVAAALLFLVGAVGLAVYAEILPVPECVAASPFIGALGQMDSGTFRVAWSSYQIIESVSWSLDIHMPEPFASVQRLLGLVSFDFLSPDCAISDTHLQRFKFASVYFWSVVPLVLAVLNWLAYHLRGMLASPSQNEGDALHRYRQHMSVFLMGSYLVLPSVARSQLVALACVDVNHHEGYSIDTPWSYWILDSAVACTSSHFRTFEIVDGCCIAVYFAIPLVWFWKLWRRKEKLNPKLQPTGNSVVTSVEALRSLQQEDADLAPYAFLYSAYRPRYYYFECVEVYRRIVFIGVLPLLTTKASRRSAFGIFFSLISLAMYRELEPFRARNNNVLVYVAQYAILLTYGAALAIETDLSHGVDDSTKKSFVKGGGLLGCILVFVNGTILGLAFWMSMVRHRQLRKEQAAQGEWRRLLTTRERDIVAGVMGYFPDGSNGLSPDGNAKGDPLMTTAESQELRQTTAAHQRDSTVSHGLRLTVDGVPVGGSSKEARKAQRLLRQHTLSPADVHLKERIGAGAFGEVLKGVCFGQPVAVKTMKKVTVESAGLFRAEILLTATLRHPNIVNFVGACWSKDLICLVLEWAARGSLADLLLIDGAGLALPKVAPPARAAAAAPGGAGGAGEGRSQQGALQAFLWDEPLLKLAQDVARGLAYLHGRQWFDEADGVAKRCVLHRDLKPANVLVTAFLSAKISDFGSAKAKEVDVTMSLVGSPLFAGPELMQGLPYDESVDVYSFGVLLLSLAMKGGDIRQFLKLRWEEDHAKAVDGLHRDPRRPSGHPGAGAYGGSVAGGSVASSQGQATLGQIVKGLWDGWRPCSNASGKEVPCAPQAVTSLVVRCCAQNPAARPAMKEVLVELMGRCAEEVEAKGPFGTWDPNAPLPQRQSSISSNAPSEDTGEGGLEEARAMLNASQKAFFPARSLEKGARGSKAAAPPPSTAAAAAAATPQKQPQAQQPLSGGRASTGNALRTPLLRQTSTQRSGGNVDGDGEGDGDGDYGENDV